MKNLSVKSFFQKFELETLALEIWILKVVIIFYPPEINWEFSKPRMLFFRPSQIKFELEKQKFVLFLKKLKYSNRSWAHCKFSGPEFRNLTRIQTCSRRKNDCNFRNQIKKLMLLNSNAICCLWYLFYRIFEEKTEIRI